MSVGLVLWVYFHFLCNHRLQREGRKKNRCWSADFSKAGAAPREAVRLPAAASIKQKKKKKNTAEQMQHAGEPKRLSYRRTFCLLSLPASLSLDDIIKSQTWNQEVHLQASRLKSFVPTNTFFTTIFLLAKETFSHSGAQTPSGRLQLPQRKKHRGGRAGSSQLTS